MEKQPHILLKGGEPRSAAGQQRQRRRNLALFFVLLALVVLIFAISLVQFGRAGDLS
ncbi:MAG: hypothetical protein ORO03_05785 [Alphaproteobacteria bacterium]|nr:hypothetical protein [Alphaproteobacteria bacterium]